MRLDELLFAPGREPDPAAPLVHGPGDAVASWDEVRRRASGLTSALRDAGVRPGAAVGVMLPNGADVVAALFGVWRAGAVHLPLNPRLTDDEVAHALDAAAPAAVIRAEGVSPAADPHGARSYDADVALVQLTSGTTGRPKPVLLTHSGVLTLLDNVLAKLRGGSSPSAKPPMPNLIPVSLSLWAGIYNVLFALRVGAPVVLMEGFEPVELARLVRRHGIRSTVLPPAAMVMLVDDPQVTDLAPLRFVRSITAPLSPLQARRFKERFDIAVLNSYGQTEIGGEVVGWNAADSRAHGETKLGSVGRPHAGVELRVVAVDAVGDGGGRVGLVDVPPGEAGELWVRAPAMSTGYADGASLRDRLTPDGWFRTGDVARVDGDGFVWIEGRVSDMINRGGLKVYPAEVEEVLRTAPAVTDTAVVAVPDPRVGEVPHAFVVANAAIDAAALEALCRQHLAAYKVPVAFDLVDALPRNDVGKVLKADLAQRAALATPRPGWGRGTRPPRR